MTGYSQRTLNNAKRLRRSMTDAETLLWAALRSRPVGAKFRRQQPIGAFIADFACHEPKLIIEVDGGQHSESETDGLRGAWLEEQGYRILRFWNHDVLNNLQGALETISAALNTPHPPIASQWAPPSPSRGEGKTDGANRG